MAPLLEITSLRTEIKLRQGVVHAVDGVSFDVEPGQTLGIVGESGCGKTMTALSIMNLLPTGGSIVGDSSIKLNGQELSTLSEEHMRSIRGNEIGMIFQDPLTSLNPTMSIGKQIAEVVSLHRDVTKEQALDRAAEVLDLVGIPRVRERIKEYPHQFSGGMRQRVMIAMALACEPKLLIADEPTTALDVTIQKQILELIDDLRHRLGMAVILVTHDLGVIAGRADRVAVMYAGKIDEITDTETLFTRPRHPYTEALFQALPDKAAEAGERLYSIPGIPPGPGQPAGWLPVRGALPLRAGQVPPGGAEADRRGCRARVPLLLPGRAVGARRTRKAGRLQRVRGPGGAAGARHRRRAARRRSPGEELRGHEGRGPAAAGRLAECRRGRELQDPQRRDVRPGGRVGLRQEHDRQAGRGP